MKTLKIAVQTELKGAWKEVGEPVSGDPPATLAIGKFDDATPVSYRVNATLEDGQAVELRGYFQVKP